MDSIDVELFIDEVRRRPSLWDPFSEAYKNRQLRKDDWSEVCATFCQDYWNKDENERVQIGKEVQRRWKSLRDCFRRELTLQKCEPSGPGGTKRRKYMFFNQLQFLMGTSEQQETTSTSDPIGGESSNVEVAEPLESIDIEQKTIKLPKAPLTRVVHRKSNNFEQSLINLLEKVSSETEDFDDDKQFLLSLLPMMKKFDDIDKLSVRVDIMNTIQQTYKKVMRIKKAKQRQHIHPRHQFQAPVQHRNSWYQQSCTPSPSTESNDSENNAENTEFLDLGEM